MRDLLIYVSNVKLERTLSWSVSAHPTCPTTQYASEAKNTSDLEAYAIQLLLRINRVLFWKLDTWYTTSIFGDAVDHDFFFCVD